MDAAAAADRLINAYNAQDFDGMEGLIATDIDFAHYLAPTVVSAGVSFGTTARSRSPNIHFNVASAASSPLTVATP